MKYLGIDWATREHVVALIDDDGQELAVWTVVHTWAAVRELLERLDGEGGAAEVLIGIEPGSARMTEVLVAAGYQVYEINPKSASRFRDRLNPSGAKDDRRDALVLAGAVRTDRGRMRPKQPASDRDQELRLRCRSRLALVDTRRRLVLQLHRILSAYYPSLLALKMPLTCGLINALLRNYPTPGAARRARRPHLAKLLQEHRIRKIDVEGLRALLREEPFPLQAGMESAYADEARWTMDQIEQVEASLSEADGKIAALFEEHPDREILMSVPGIGVTLAPYIAAEIQTTLGDAPAIGALQATAGTAPRTKRSGRQTHGQVSMRQACHRGLQSALYSVARGSRAKSEWARAYYAAARERGMRRNSALRAMSNKWAKIIAVMLTRRECYDEQRHAANLRRGHAPWAPSAEQGVAA